MIDRWVHAIEKNIAIKLPGVDAQMRMAPSLRQAPGLQIDPRKSHPSAVLLLLFPSENELATVFILRTNHGPHGGQISLPGGRMEDDDPDLVTTSLRETHEEVGVNPHFVRILGSLTLLHVPNSNNMIYPFVGITRQKPIFIPDPDEVEDIIVVPVNKLFDSSSKKEITINKEDYRIVAPYYDVSGHVIWGATAMILSEFEEIFTSCIFG